MSKRIGQGYFHSESREECLDWVSEDYGPEMAEVARRFIDGEGPPRTTYTVDEVLNTWTY